ncbi:MAG: dihydrolipoyl dehydrogenase [Clostridiales bacterium]|nr:dihydrolipoyl dehydrogenase [Clostridiales bacterium]
MKIVVLGGGPGGYVAAIRAAQLGAEVIIIEKNKLGGTCLNVGCIPTKVLLHTADVVETLKHAEKIGVQAENVTINWEQLMTRKTEVVNQLVGGVEALLSSNGVEIINGLGVFESEKSIRVTKGDDRGRVIEFDNCILALGSQASLVPIPGIENEGVIISDEALSLAEIPKRLVIIGGGVIGSEFAQIYSSFGSDVTIVEMAESIIPSIDSEITNFVREKFISKRVKIYEKSRVLEIKKSKSLIVTIQQLDGTFEIETDKILVAVGRKPATEFVGLEKIGIKTNNGMISVDSRMRTNKKGIYAIGDCNGGIMLAHVASAEGIVAVETIMNMKPQIDFKTIPSAVYTQPEIASVGLSEQEAREKGLKVNVGKFPLIANGKSIIMMEEGLVKIVADVDTKEILGVQIVGPRATDLIAEAAIALRLEATVDELISTIHAHPTVSEAVMEAGHGVFDYPIHLMK